MKKVITYLTILMSFLSCKSQCFNVGSLCGTYDGVEGGKTPLSTYVLLELNMDHTCSLKKSFDLSLIAGYGEWAILDDGEIELTFNNNPVLDDVEKALMGGGFIEGTLRVKVLSKNKLKIGDEIPEKPNQKSRLKKK